MTASPPRLRSPDSTDEEAPAEVGMPIPQPRRRGGMMNRFGFWSELVWLDFMDNTMGSPRAILKAQNFHMYVTTFNMILHLPQLVTAPIYLDTEIAYILALQIFETLSVVGLLVHIWLWWRLIPRSRELNYQFEQQGQPVLTQFLELLASRKHRQLQLYSVGFGCGWFLLCLVWEAALPPCSKFNGFNSLGKYGLEGLPCEMWECASTSCVIWNMLSYAQLTALPSIVRRFRTRFDPTTGDVGLPRNWLDALPTYEFHPGTTPSARSPDGTPTLANPETIGTTIVASQQDSCCICMEDFVIGCSVRQLPCGHTFHNRCIDAWLARKASCPMRCHTNLFEHARGLQQAQGRGSPAQVVPSSDHNMGNNSNNNNNSSNNSTSPTPHAANASSRPNAGVVVGVVTPSSRPQQEGEQAPRGLAAEGPVQRGQVATVPPAEIVGASDYPQA